MKMRVPTFMMMSVPYICFSRNRLKYSILKTHKASGVNKNKEQ